MALFVNQFNLFRTPISENGSGANAIFIEGVVDRNTGSRPKMNKGSLLDLRAVRGGQTKQISQPQISVQRAVVYRLRDVPHLDILRTD